MGGGVVRRRHGSLQQKSSGSSIETAIFLHRYFFFFLSRLVLFRMDCSLPPPFFLLFPFDSRGRIVGSDIASFLLLLLPPQSSI